MYPIAQRLFCMCTCVIFRCFCSFLLLKVFKSVNLFTYILSSKYSVRNPLRYLVKLSISLLTLKFSPRTEVNIQNITHVDQNYNLEDKAYQLVSGTQSFWFLVSFFNLGRKYIFCILKNFISVITKR